MKIINRAELSVLSNLLYVSKRFNDISKKVLVSKIIKHLFDENKDNSVILFVSFDN